MTKKGTGSKGPGAQKIRLMLVDDHSLVRDAISRLLEEEKDFKVVAVTGEAAEVEAVAEKHSPDVILMDIELPTISGLDVARNLLQRNPNERILFVTMHQHEEYALRGLRAGALGYVLKNSKAEELIEAIRTVAQGDTYITREISDRIARTVARNTGKQAFSQLSEREFQVLRGLALGKSCKQLAEEFGLSVKTIYTYRTRLLVKLELKNDIDLLRFALRHKLLTGESEPLTI